MARQELLVVYRETEPPNRVEELKKRLPKLPNFNGPDGDGPEEDSKHDEPTMRWVQPSLAHLAQSQWQSAYGP